MTYLKCSKNLKAFFFFYCIFFISGKYVCLTSPSLYPARWLFVRNISRSNTRRTNLSTPTCSRNLQRGIQRWGVVISAISTMGRGVSFSKSLSGNWKKLSCFFSPPSLLMNRKKQRRWRVTARRMVMIRWRLRTEKRKLQAKRRRRLRCDYYGSSVLQTFVTSAICV